ncbi:inositol 2-dehydrogenase [Paenarthrobacter ureafaciens]|uniref:Gfo/Idh/MocA family protein n=1 Tax=Paenarthrobacter TaxID=1742992 RepID=UPI0015BEBA97|nr:MULTISPECIES: Gfo/Idh/MocA family oxidoreductase [Paenarthrobacter]NWL29288.1 inositol 2-dehydrogenase [Paenarthrobacter ureafaciens]QSZ54019.1 inositol 2-dehydrogenase [Paenarthrobacter ureafaciens]WOC62807.1 Gfo/Idh/MocA family oxidoreductase [Paenarthrobacter sp. AT5]BCW84038.1 myo-inositol dehydrogenase [Arthrobacter sp. NicSoilE8]
MTVRVGVIGTGVMGAEHARILQGSISGATVTAVADTMYDRAQAVAADTGARSFDSAEKLIASPFVDAVLIASHDSVHAEQVKACLAEGKAVLCEKPLAPTIEECQEIVDLEALVTGNPKVSVGFMRRFHPAYQDLKSKLQQGTVGQPLMMLSSHRNVHSYPGGDSASTITNSGIHEIDITAWLLDSPIDRVSWHAPRSTSADTRQDPQVFHLYTADGVLTIVDVFVNARYGYDVRCEVVGEQGSMEMARPQQTTLHHGLQQTHGYPDDWRPVFADAYRRQTQAWIDSLAAGRPSPLATATEARNATRVAQALITSMENGGTTVDVDHEPATQPQPVRATR